MEYTVVGVELSRLDRLNLLSGRLIYCASYSGIYPMFHVLVRFLLLISVVWKLSFHSAIIGEIFIFQAYTTIWPWVFFVCYSQIQLHYMLYVCPLAPIFFIFQIEQILKEFIWKLISNITMVSWMYIWQGSGVLALLGKNFSNILSRN